MSSIFGGNFGSWYDDPTVIMTVYMCHCGIEFGIRPEFAKLRAGQKIFCPNGHECKIPESKED